MVTARARMRLSCGAIFFAAKQLSTDIRPKDLIQKLRLIFFYKALPLLPSLTLTFFKDFMEDWSFHQTKLVSV
jgi:hypothetical protein